MKPVHLTPRWGTDPRDEVDTLLLMTELLGTGYDLAQENSLIIPRYLESMTAVAEDWGLAPDTDTYTVAHI